jgi:hypothetical protein
VAIEARLALEKQLEKVKLLAQSVRDAIRDLGARFHPVALARGVLCSAEEVEARFLGGFEAVRAAVAAAGVGDRPRVTEALDEAQRTLPSLMATVHGWYRIATAAAASLGLSAAETAWVWSTLLPTVYPAARRGYRAVPRRSRRARWLHGALKDRVNDHLRQRVWGALLQPLLNLVSTGQYPQARRFWMGQMRVLFAPTAPFHAAMADALRWWTQRQGGRTAEGSPRRRPDAP